MKVTNWRRKLAASLVAGGLMSPVAATAADLNTNLVTNGDFETVDFGTTGDYGAPMVVGWSGGPGFAYSHNGTNGIPDYADGPDPPGAGSWYFSSNNNPDAATGDWRAPDQVFQDIAVGTGATGTQIASGEAAYRLSAYMSSYLNDNDSGNVQIDFKNSGGTTISSAVISDPDFGPNNVWSLTSAVGVVPVGTTSIRASLFGTPRNSGADGYIDNVDVRVIDAATVLLFMQVNTTTGQMSLRNLTGQPVAIDYYEVTSASNALNATAWNSFQEQNVAGFPPGNGSGNGWEQAGGSDSGVIGESYLTGNSTVVNGANLGLGAAFNLGGAHDLMFRYGAVLNTSAVPAGDYNNNGTVDAADYAVWRDRVGTTNTMPNDPIGGTIGAAQYNQWRANFGLAGGATGTSTLFQGFVRYVTSGAAVPEPSTVWLAALGIAAAWPARRRTTNTSS